MCVKYVESCVCWCVSFMCKAKVEVLCVFGFQQKKRRVSPAPTHVPDSPAQPRNSLHEHALFCRTHTHQSTFDCALNERPRVRAFFLCEVVELHG